MLLGALAAGLSWKRRRGRPGSPRPLSGKTLAIFGCGPIGLFSIAVVNMLAIANLPREIHLGREFRAFLSSCVAMIALMTPEGFAALMGTMWPELIDAMPFGMGPMMRLMGKIPGSLELMKPLFPILFPRLLPMMMPKVMSTMLERVAERIPMPDYMREQMPSLMPKVMDNLMPHMIGDVVPLVTQPMIDYLRGRKPAS